MKRIVIKDVPPSNNKQLAMHHMERHRRKKRFAQAIANGAGLGPWFVSGRGKRSTRPGVKAHVKVVMYRRCRVLQDPDNRVASIKMVLDALQATGWLCGDSDQWLRLEVEEVRDNGPKGGRTEIFIERDGGGAPCQS
jgi:hypothetical protein